MKMLIRRTGRGAAATRPLGDALPISTMPRIETGRCGVASTSRTVNAGLPPTTQARDGRHLPGAVMADPLVWACRRAPAAGPRSTTRLVLWGVDHACRSVQLDGLNACPYAGIGATAEPTRGPTGDRSSGRPSRPGDSRRSDTQPTGAGLGALATMCAFSVLGCRRGAPRTSTSLPASGPMMRPGRPGRAGPPVDRADLVAASEPGRGRRTCRRTRPRSGAATPPDCGTGPGAPGLAEPTRSTKMSTSACRKCIVEPATATARRCRNDCWR